MGLEDTHPSRPWRRSSMQLALEKRWVSPLYLVGVRDFTAVTNSHLNMNAVLQHRNAKARVPTLSRRPFPMGLMRLATPEKLL
jgi:hypothetical protein